jgi:hypothetical protein
MPTGKVSVTAGKIVHVTSPLTALVTEQENDALILAESFVSRI